MPFMSGSAPIRRTTAYLELGKIIFRENVKIFSVNYNNTKSKHHEGAREFIFWNLPQIQYNNPQVQCITFRNLTPSPFIRIFLEDGKSVLIDIDSRKKEDIVDHLENFTAICKAPNEIVKKQEVKKLHPSYFGYECERHCICEILGQVPCPGVIAVPKVWRGVPNPLKFKIPPSFMEPGLEDDDGGEE